jgi:hypothetical protein
MIAALSSVWNTTGPQDGGTKAYSAAVEASSTDVEKRPNVSPLAAV